MEPSEIDSDLITNFKTISKEEFLRFCENTTLRGVPRIVKSRKTHIRHLWLTFFILLFIGFLVCIIFLCYQYLEYNVIHPPRILSDNKAPFPSLTVCNFRPMSRNILNIMKKLNIKDPREFAHSINKYAIEHYYNKKLLKNYQRASSIMNMGAYLESVPNRTFNELGHDEKDLIIYCQVTYMNGSSPHYKVCSDIGKWRVIIHAQYINCYSYNLYENYSRNTNTMELYFYLDQGTPDNMCMDCFSSDVKSQLSGALILIHRRLTFPNFNHDIINLQPGTLTEIKLKIFNNVHKEPPYGRCSYKSPKTMKIYNDLYSYSEHACKLLTIQHDINKQCGCNAIEYPIDNFNLSFCSNLPRFIEGKLCHDDLTDMECKRQLDLVVKKIICKSNVSSQYQKDIVKSCSLPCDIYSYDSDRSTSSWPTKTWQMPWIASRAAKRLRKKPELKIYTDAYRLFLNGSVRKSFQILNQQNILEQNLLAVMINRPNYNVHLVEEKEVLSLTSFLSQAGGLCSIWIGLTMISIVEVIEMILNCFSQFKTLRKRKEHFSARELQIQNINQNNYWLGHETEFQFISSVTPIHKTNFILQDEGPKDSNLSLYNSNSKHDKI